MKHRRLKKWLLPIVGFLIICVYLFPIYWMVISSFKTSKEIFATVPTLFPKEFTLNAYRNALAPERGFVRTVFNSTIISSGAMILSLVISVPAAYGLARRKIKGAPLLLAMVLLLQLFPPSVLSLPIFSSFSKLGLVDNYWGVILANMTISTPFIIVIMRTFFVGLPKDLEDAAMIDGCRPWGAFLRVMLPISKAGLATCAIFGFVYAWGEFMYSLILLNNNKYWPITMGIRQYDGNYGTQWSEMMAVATISSLPVILIFLFSQKYIVSGVTAGAVKG